MRPAVVLSCLVGSLCVAGATMRGAGLSPDSTQYLASAESAARGQGLMTIAWEGEPAPLTHFPPGYPLVLAAAAGAGWSPQQFARWANIVLFALTIVVASVIARRIAPESAWAAPIVALACALAPDLVAAHSMVWTEPAYVTLTLGGALALASAIDRKSLSLLAVAGLAAGAAAVLRYIGVANIAVAGAAVLLWWPESFWRRVRAAGGVSILAAAPLVLALAYAAVASEGPAANRRLQWHPIGADDLWMLVAVVGKWVSPTSDANVLTAIWLAALAVLGGAIVASRLRARMPVIAPWKADGLVRVLVLYAAMYMLALVAAMSLADAQIGFDDRLLAPVLPVAIILGVVWLMRPVAPNRTARRAAWAIVALVLVAEVSRSAPVIREAHDHGLALRRLDPSARPLVTAATRLPESARIYSNRPFFLRAQTARTILGVPRGRDPNTLLPNERLGQQIQAICDRAATEPVYLVLFGEAESEDPTVDAHVPASAGEVVPVPGGGQVIRVRPRCQS